MSEITNVWDQAKEVVSTWDGHVKVRGKKLPIAASTAAIQALVQTHEVADPFYDYYFLMQEIRFCTNDVYARREANELAQKRVTEGPYAKCYEIGLAPASAGAWRLVASSPETVINQESVTTGLNWGLSGNLGFFGGTPTVGWARIMALA